MTDLLPGDVEDRVYARFIASPAMRSLTRIEAHSAVEPLRDLPPLPPSITHLACPTASVADVTRALPSDSQLRWIAIADSEIDALLAARWFPQLDAVTVAGNVRRNLARWPVLPRPMTLTLAPSASLPPCTTTFPWDYAITLRREGDATIAQISGAWLLLPIEVLSALPGDTARIEVDHTSAALIDRLRGGLARPAIEIVQRSASRLAAVFMPATRR